MALSLASLKTKVLNILQKETSYQGFYTDSKLEQGINESMDYIAARAMHEMGQGWFQDISYITTVADTPGYALPPGTALVREVRYLSGDIYLPLRPIEAVDEPWTSDDTQVVFPWRYELIGGQIVFNPIPSIVGTNYLQLKVTRFPTELTAGVDTLPTQCSRPLEWYLIYRTATLLCMAVGNPNPEWQQKEGEWYRVFESMITARIKKPKYVRDFRF